jgi:putative Ca2+/H+ antiporter (TMEM165/GDT1 family)
MEAFLVSTGVAALAELGDKSQLLVLTLATQYRRPIPIILGMLVATVLNHTAAGVAGTWLAATINPVLLRSILALSFIGIAIWTLIPSKRPQRAPSSPRFGVFAMTAATFFLLEMGDKTQFAAIALAAKYGSLLPVVAGTTVGILLADVPVVLLSSAAAGQLPLKSVHKFAAVLFLVLGAMALGAAHA